MPELPNPSYGNAQYALGPNDELFVYAYVSQTVFSLVHLTLAGDVITTEQAANSDVLFEERTDEPAFVTGP